MTFQVFFGRTVLLIAEALALVALWFLRDTLMLAFAAAIIVVGVNLPSVWFQRRGVPRGAATALSALLITVTTAVLVLWSLPSLAEGLGNLLTRLPEFLENVGESYNVLRTQNDTLARLLPAAQKPRLSSLSEAEVGDILNRFVSTGLPVLASQGSVVLSLLTNFGLVLVLTLLLLIDPTAYVRASMYLAPKPRHLRLLALWKTVYQTLGVWLSTLSISIVTTVSLVLLVLGPLGMPNVQVVAVFAGFATFVPNVGAFLPLIVIVVFTLAEDPSKLVVMAAAYLLIQLLESNVLTPLIVKQRLSLPAAGVFFFQIVAGIVFGLLGVLLAVPLLAVATALVRELYSYDVLGLRNERVDVFIDRSGALGFREAETPAGAEAGRSPRSRGRQTGPRDDREA